MTTQETIPLLEDILVKWKNEIGADYLGYKNHVYRMIHFCFALHTFSAQERDKVIIAGCFHDLGIWTGRTFDYLPPSIALADAYLKQNGLSQWAPEITLMIDMHHKLTKYPDTRSPLVEVFREGDLVDFSLGVVNEPDTCVEMVKGRKDLPDCSVNSAERPCTSSGSGDAGAVPARIC